MGASSDDVIHYEIVMDAAAALAALDELAKKGLTLADGMKLIQQAIQETADKTGASFSQVAATFKEVSESVPTGEGQGIFAKFFGNPQEVENMAKKVETDMKQVSTTGKEAYGQVAAAEQEATTAARGFFDITNMVRMALGTLEAMVIFQVVMAIGQAFRDASAAAAEYYQALINVTTAQKLMAQQGVATTNQELLALADELEKKMKIFAHVDMVDAVSQAALMTSQFKLSVDQVGQIVQMASVLSARTPGSTPTEFIDKILTAARGSTAQWAMSLGISLDAGTIKAKALAMGLWDGKEAISEQAKELAGLQILWERIGPQIDTVSKNITSSTEISTKLKSTWKDFAETLGTTMSPLTDLFKIVLIGDLEAGMAFLKAYMELAKEVWAYIAGAVNIVNELMLNHVHSIQDMIDAYTKGHDAVTRFFDNLQKRIQTGGVDLSQNAPVSPQAPQTEGPPALTESDFNALYKAYQSYYESVIKATEDFNLRMQNLQDQYNLNVQKEIENYDLRVAEEKQNFRLKQEQEEQDFQERMRQLTERYLLDLEDALRKRDAEAVIKIIERYNMEKDAAGREEQLKRQQEKEQERLKLEQMKREEELRLKQMKDEYELQQEEARRAYQNQLNDLARALDQKLQEQAVKIGEEYKLNHDGVEKLYALFQQYYGPNGKFASEQQASYIKMVAQSQAFVDQMTALMSQYYSMLGGLGSGTGLPKLEGGAPIPSGGGLGSAPRTGGGKGYATGGYALATQATNVTFGEGGVPELAMFLPLNSGMSNPALDVYGSGGGPGGGVALIRIEVGSDLEARIVNAALTHAALAIEKVNRSR